MLEHSRFAPVAPLSFLASRSIAQPTDSPIEKLCSTLNFCGLKKRPPCQNFLSWRQLTVISTYWQGQWNISGDIILFFLFNILFTKFLLWFWSILLFSLHFCAGFGPKFFSGFDLSATASFCKLLLFIVNATLTEALPGIVTNDREPLCLVCHLYPSWKNFSFAKVTCPTNSRVAQMGPGAGVLSRQSRTRLASDIFSIANGE